MYYKDNKMEQCGGDWLSKYAGLFFDKGVRKSLSEEEI